jgi:hypothetical protein
MISTVRKIYDINCEKMDVDILRGMLYYKHVGFKPAIMRSNSIRDCKLLSKSSTVPVLEMSKHTLVGC